jgi:hypothetical protein
MRSFPACYPKIVSEYLSLSQMPEYLPLYQTPNTSPFCKGGWGDLTIGQRKPRTSPPFPKDQNISLFRKSANISPFRKSQNISPFCKGGRGDFHSRQVMVETEAVMEKI